MQIVTSTLLRIVLGSIQYLTKLLQLDVYAFLCPNCKGNSEPTSAVASILSGLKTHNVTYSNLWIDVGKLTLLLIFLTPIKNNARVAGIQAQPPIANTSR
jgi:hypothetical protein